MPKMLVGDAFMGQVKCLSRPNLAHGPGFADRYAKWIYLKSCCHSGVFWFASLHLPCNIFAKWKFYSIRIVFLYYRQVVLLHSPLHLLPLQLLYTLPRAILEYLTCVFVSLSLMVLSGIHCAYWSEWVNDLCWFEHFNSQHFDLTQFT